MSRLVNYFERCSDFCHFSTAMLDLLNARLDHHEKYLVVFIGVQNLAEIDAVVLIIYKFSYFACLA